LTEHNYDDDDELGGDVPLESIADAATYMAGFQLEAELADHRPRRLLYLGMRTVLATGAKKAHFMGRSAYHFNRMKRESDTYDA